MSDGRVHYARNGDVRLAYRIFGDSGPVFIWAAGWVVNNVDTIDEPNSPYAGLVERLSQGTRFVMYDRPAGQCVTSRPGRGWYSKALAPNGSKAYPRISRYSGCPLAR